MSAGKGPPADTSTGFKVRFRIKLAKALTSDAPSLDFTLIGRAATLTSQEKDQPLKNSPWTVLHCGGFATEDEARAFGDRVRPVIELAGLCSNVGADVGQDKASSFVSEDWARAEGFLKPDERLIQNVHGLTVIPDDDKTRIALLNVTATVSAQPSVFLDALAEISPDFPEDFSIVDHGVRALNLALISQEPLSTMAIALSAVEALGQGETWTYEQRTLLKELANLAEQKEGMAEAERQEVADALRRSVQRLGLRQGVLRVLEKIGRTDLKKEWDTIYGRRSEIFHGTLQARPEELGDLANQTQNLCSRIILAYAMTKGVKLPKITESRFPDIFESAI